MSTTTAVARGEWTKMTSIPLVGRVVLWATLVAVGVTAALAAALGSRERYCAESGTCVNPAPPSGPEVATAGVLGDGLPGAALIALMVFGALVVLVDHRYRTIGTTWMVTPARHRVLLTQAALVGAVAFLVALSATLLSGVAFAWLGGPAADGYSPVSGVAWQLAARTALMVALAAVLAVGLAGALRRTPVVLALVIVWPALVESLLPSLVPGGGESVAVLLPFNNLRHFVGLADGLDFHWGPWGSAAYFAAVTAGVLAAGVVSTQRARFT